MNIAYCGYDFFHGCLRYLLSNGHNILKVFTFDCDNRFNHNTYVYEICKQHQLPITQSAICSADLQDLKTHGCELLITAGYRYKVPELDSLGLRGINVHPTLLSLGRGVWPLPWIILNEHHTSGVSVHKLAQEYDSGDILLQSQFPVTQDENLESLSCKTQMYATQTLAEVMNRFEDKWLNAMVQDENNASLWPMPQRSHRTLDWSKSVAELDRIARAFGKFGCFAFFDSQWWCVYDLNAWSQYHNEQSGMVVHKTNTEMVVAASDGFVCLRVFEPITAMVEDL